MPETNENPTNDETQDKATDETAGDESASGADEASGQEPPKSYDEDYVKGLRAEAANYRTRLREAEAQLQEASKSAQTVEELREANATFTAQVAELERRVLASEVARRFELPDELAARLTGNTQEELEADAKALAKFASPKAPDSLSGGLDPRDTDTTSNNPRELAKQFGRR